MSLSQILTIKRYLGHINSIPSLIILLLCSSASYANDFTNTFIEWWQYKEWRPLLEIGAGVSTTSSIGQSQNFPIVNPVTDEFFSYSASHYAQTSGLVDVFGGAEWQLDTKWFLQTGFGYSAPSAFSAKGALVQGADLQSSDYYNYSYNILARQILWETKILYTIKDFYHPFLFVGLGTAFNRSYNFQTTVPSNLTFTRLYEDKTTTSFTYSLGCGIDVDVYHNLRLSLGYRFADLGETEFGKTYINTHRAAGSIQQSHVYTNQVLSQLTWLF